MKFVRGGELFMHLR